MQEQSVADGLTRVPGTQEIVVLVNERPVTLLGHRHTGLEIKQAAITQRVAIGLDFVLSIEHGPQQTKIIENNEVVTVTKTTRFVAVADDDNS